MQVIWKLAKSLRTSPSDAGGPKALLLFSAGVFSWPQFAHADAGLPLIAGSLPLALLLCPLVAHIEWKFLRNILPSPGACLWLKSFLANLVSTIAGAPIGYAAYYPIVKFLDLLSEKQLPSDFHVDGGASFLSWIVYAFEDSKALVGPSILLAIILGMLLCVSFAFFASVAIEKWVYAIFFRITLTWQQSLATNLRSYCWVVLPCFLLVFLIAMITAIFFPDIR